MKAVISQLVDDFHERALPQLSPRRDCVIRELVGKASVIIGMRRVGKTFRCFQKIAKQMASGLPKTRILYMNFEDARLLDFSVKDFQSILDVYYGKFPDQRNSTCHFFFDDIQRIDHWESFIRRLLDTEDVRIFLTGSSAKLLGGEIATCLRGRSLTTEVFPLTFAEFLSHHGRFDALPCRFGAKTSAVLRHAISDYLAIGGFPEVQGVDRSLQIDLLQGYIDSVLLRDVIERHNVGNVVALKHLVNCIMNSPGGKFSVNKFHNTLQSLSIKCGKNDLYEYLDHLMDAYLFYRVPLHTRSEKARLVNPAKVYVVDTGLLQAMTFRHSADRGHLLENLVFMHLRSRGFSIEYVHGAGGAEVDFLARHPATGKELLVQACWDTSDKPTLGRELRGLRSAMAEMNIKAGTIVSWDDEAEIDDTIRVVPAWKWLLTPTLGGNDHA